MSGGDFDNAWMRKTYLKSGVFAAALRRLRRHFGWLLALHTGIAVAQTPTLPRPVADRATQITQLRYESALSNYRPYADEPLQSWRDANATVGQIGGWRAYAKEAQAKEAQAEEPGKERPAADPHSGHHGGAKP